MINDPLREALCEFVRELQPAGIKLIVGGGYGLVLRARHLQSTNARTLRAAIPMIRGTEDIDCFLQNEIITSAERTEAIRSALDRLGYKPEVEHMQFKRTTTRDGAEATTKVDFLAGPLPDDDQGKVRHKGMRIRPRAFNKLHAYFTPEAFSVEEKLLEIDVSPDQSGLFVYLPHPFSYLVLKLSALRDRIDEGERGKYHALDLFTVWSMITEAEWDEAVQMRDRFGGNEMLLAAAQALDLFASSTSMGSITVKDQARRQGIDLTNDDIASFAAGLRELLVAQ
jgi:hypothetical protein